MHTYVREVMRVCECVQASDRVTTIMENLEVRKFNLSLGTVREKRNCQGNQLLAN